LAPTELRNCYIGANFSHIGAEISLTDLQVNHLLLRTASARTTQDADQVLENGKGSWKQKNDDVTILKSKFEE
jgi:hypothetical protein